ncbi:MFS transporter [Actinospica durhamensis]|uniref:MFS transporter n=1 Tax=Actinospica durhamensis TaxID=1508375 RepID=A0A941IVP6_9ACTN|nr:MFS transporter [Actinospica durhamensis]MBR7837566.1 MFS transporter [Actinospica durhamensis]
MTTPDEPPQPETLRRFRRVRRSMAAGLLASLSGSFVVAGVVPGAVAAGALSIVWLPVIQSVETLEDMSSPAVARLLRDRNPGHVLVACEAFDAAACALALALIYLTPIRPAAIFIAYVLVASAVPLFVDVAEELFTGEIAKISRGEALRFNISIYAMIGFTGSLVAKPLGSVLATAALPAALGINLGASLVGLLLRLRSVRSMSVFDDEAPEQASDGETDEPQPKAAHPSAPLGKIIGAAGPGSPAVSGLLACSTAIVTGYLAQWVVHSMAHPSGAMAALLVATGVGATIGPYLARPATVRERFTAGAGLLLTARIAALGAILAIALMTGAGSTARFTAMLVLNAGFGATVVASSVVQATARQSHYQGHALAQAVGWSHSFAAAGTFIGVWCGLALGVQCSPVVGILLAAAVALAAMARLSPRSQTSTRDAAMATEL